MEEDDAPSPWCYVGVGLMSSFVTGTGFLVLSGSQAAACFATGYILEMCLSLDNLFAFYLVFQYYKLKNAKAQARVLTWGIFGAVVLRALMISAGAAALKQWSHVMLIAAVILIYSGGQLVLGMEEDDDEDLSDNKVVKLARCVTPSMTADYHEDSFVHYSPTDGCQVTPLLLVLVTIEFSDIAFAVDSVPAIFGITDDPFIVWAACLSAVMCLRSLYSLIVNAVTELEYMGRAIGLVLLFIAGKIVADVLFHKELAVWVTLVVVAVILGMATVCSVQKRQREALAEGVHELDGLMEKGVMVSEETEQADLEI
eukprot:TRINITY_DN3166_c0_g1_i1.p1 TRINITY_DN3166_c0_g1~~TRINITY_DN3166_c0_g1_i1.p1  ORF type:complete len:313 (+),score=73.67 TRINITY_DN3166_c0_g1_i1:203-1141(+)